MGDTIFKAVPIEILNSVNLKFPVEMETYHRSGLQIEFSLGNILFEQFRAKDTQALYEIRNHPTVRPFMPSPDPITFDKHQEWVELNLITKHKNTPLVMIGFMESEPVGFGILKPTVEPKTLEIGVIVTGKWQQNSTPARLAAAMFSIAAQIFGADTLISFVHPQNKQALRFNQGGSLIRLSSSEKSGEIQFRTPITIALKTPIYYRCCRGLTIHVK